MIKKIERIFIVSVFSFLTAFFTACSDIDSDAYVFENEKPAVAGNTQSFRFSVASKSTLLSTNFSSSRTITPAAYKASDLNFYLGGVLINTKNSNSPVIVQRVPFIPSESSPSSGVITAELGNYTYELVLIAIPSANDTVSLNSTTLISDLVNSAVLYGAATADLKYNGGSEVNFFLSTDALTGDGSCDLKFYLSDWSNASLNTINPSTGGNITNSVKIGLYSINNGKPLENSELTGQILSGCVSEATALPYVKNAVPSGTYDLVVSFSYGDKTFVYGDKIIILPYQKTSAVVAVPDILQAVPSAPTNFRQGYILPVSDETEYYRVAFDWEDNSNTETGFEIQLLDVSDNVNAVASAVNDETFWENNAAAENIISYDSGLKGSTDWYAGSLVRNSTNVIINVALGKRYYARIRSVNYSIGNSSWAYASSANVTVTVPVGQSTAENASLTSPANFVSQAFHTPIINLFRLSYNFVGGTLTSSVSTKYYFDQVAGGNPVFAPDGATVNSAYNSENAVTLSNGSLKWYAWSISSVSGKVYPNSFTQCASAAEYNSSTIYYVRNLQPVDINGSTIIYEPANPQPNSFTDDSFANYYTNDNVPTNYLGYKNLSLYALYRDDGSSSAVTDYNVNTNLLLSVNVDGTPLTLSSSAFSVPANTNQLNIVCNYKTSVRYDSITVLVSEDGAGEIGTYTSESQNFVIPVSADLSSGKNYIITIRASKSGATYSRSLFVTVEN